MFKKLNIWIVSLILARLTILIIPALAEELTAQEAGNLLKKQMESLMPSTSLVLAQSISAVVFLLIIGAIVICKYYFAYKTKIAMIEKGLSPRIPSLLNTLKSGIIYTAVGLGITTVLWVTRVKGLQLLFGLIPLSVGIGLIIYYVVVKKEES